MSAARGALQNRPAQIALFVIVLAFAAILPLLLPPTDGTTDFAITALTYVMMALGLNIVVGFAGLLDLGYVAFYAIGSYALGWLASGFFANSDIHFGVSGVAETLPGIHMSWLIVAIVAAVVAALGGIIIGLPTLRLRGDYIAIVTLAFGEIIRVFALNGDSINLAKVPLLGGAMDAVLGVGNTAPLTAGRQGITPVDPIDPLVFDKFGPLDLRPWYWVALILVLITLFINFRLRDSRLGRAWIAVREDEVAAASMGVPLVRTKLMAYATGAALGGVAGAFLSSYQNTVNADSFQFSFSIFVLAMVILGGLGSIWGVVVGAIVLAYINFQFIPDTLSGWLDDLGVGIDPTEITGGIFGFLLVVMMIVRPEGLIPERRRKLELEEGIGVGETDIGGEVHP
ncbi:MAG: hypothetical protein U0T02_08915 [Solirubrobacteraceae bacterium]